MPQPSAPELDLSTLPKVVCVLDLETSGKDALKPDRANLAVVGLKVYTWDGQLKAYLPVYTSTMPQPTFWRSNSV